MTDVPRVPPEEDPYTARGEVTTRATVPRPRMHVHSAYRWALSLVAGHPVLLGLGLLSGAAGGLLGVLSRAPVESPLPAALAALSGALVVAVAWAVAYRYVAVDYREVTPALTDQLRVALGRLPRVAVVGAVVALAGVVPAAVVSPGGTIAVVVLGLPAGLVAAGATALSVPAVVVDGRRPREALETAVEHARDVGTLLVGTLAASALPVVAIGTVVEGLHGSAYATGAALAGVVATLGHLALGHLYVELEAP